MLTAGGGRIGTKVAALGASFVEQSAFTALQGMLGGRATILGFGIGGQRSDQIALRVPDVISAGAGACVVDAGGNDVLQDYAAAVIIANLQGIYAQLAAAGISILACTIQPIARYGAQGTPAREAVRAEVEAWIRAQPRPFFDYAAAIGNGGSPPGVAPAYDAGDGLHLNTAGRLAASRGAHRDLFGGATW